jgi:hypothetical protein
VNEGTSRPSAFAVLNIDRQFKLGGLKEG